MRALNLAQDAMAINRSWLYRPHMTASIRVTFVVQYPPEYGLESYSVTFDLWPGYGCRSSHQAHAYIVALMDGPQPFTVLDAQGEAWSFYQETVQAVAACEDNTGTSQP